MADNYKITGQTEVLDLSAPSGPVPSVEVAYETIPHGIMGTVRIPKANYNAATVHDIVTKQAQEREDVAGL